jgi:hypothetical protein
MHTNSVRPVLKVQPRVPFAFCTGYTHSGSRIVLQLFMSVVLKGTISYSRVAGSRATVAPHAVLLTEPRLPNLIGTTVATISSAFFLQARKGSGGASAALTSATEVKPVQCVRACD